MAAHAKLSASGSKKWITCAGSVRAEALMPNEDSTFAAEGTFGHALFEHRMCRYLSRPTEHLWEDLLPGHAQYWSQELSDSVDEALQYAIGRVEHARSVCKDPVILLEQRLDFSAWVPEGFGTGDLVIITDSYIEVLDLKMGAGVSVSAYDNSQFRLYMLGAYAGYGDLYNPATVRGTVMQPRLSNYSSEELTTQDLLDWADAVVLPAAQLAWSGQGPFVPGDHCSSGFCRARFTCKARADANMLVAQSDFALRDPELMDDEQISIVLTKAPAAIKWLTDVQAYALAQANTGRVFAGHKLVAGKSSRRYGSADAVGAALLAAGYPEPLVYERSLIGLTAAEKLLGKKKFAEVLDGLIVKPAGSPVLAPVSDKREALDPTASAVVDFTVLETL